MRNMNEVDRKRIEWLVWWIVSKATTEEYARRIVEQENFMEDVIEDIAECSAWYDEGYFNEDDVRMAVGRVLMNRLAVEY